MARLSLLKILLLSLFAATNANPLLSQQQPIANPDSPVHTTDGWDWKNCGFSDDLVDIKSITVFPDPPKPGKDLTVTVHATTEERVDEGAYADVLVKLGVVKILTKRFDICEEARQANTSIQCPVNPGDYTVTQTVTLPREIPRAKFTVQAHGYTVDDDPMFCVELHVNFMKRPFPKFSLGW
ncbi:ML domain-containing protein [Russula dissimulans]|nr:ML domain-containing protein [Russula dissimulans]